MVLKLRLIGLLVNMENIKQLPNLNVIRFFLSIVVVLYHIPISSESMNMPYFNDFAVFNKGELAVYYFFTLSGFLIIRNLYIENKNKNKIDLFQFYIRRASRIWPLYFSVILIGLIVYNLILPEVGLSKKYDYNLLNLLIYYIGFIPNIFNHHHKVGGILNILWSIGVEEQFYIIIPLIVMFFKNTKKVLLFLFVITFLLFLLKPGVYRYQNYYFYFIIGGLSSICGGEIKNRTIYNKKYSFMIVFLFILIFFTDFVDFKSKISFHFFHSFFSAIFFHVISYNTPEIFKNKSLEYFGKISYAIYMLHMIVLFPVLFLVSKLSILKNQDILSIVIINLTTIILTVWLAHLSHKYFESKIINYANRFFNKKSIS